MSAATVTPQKPDATIPGLNAFVGDWNAHGAHISLDTNGQAHFEARVYTWCGSGVSQPCDSISNNQIHNGYSVNIQFTRVNSTTAYGVITSGNMGNNGKPASLILTPGNEILFVVQDNSRVLCGPQAAVGACGA